MVVIDRKMRIRLIVLLIISVVVVLLAAVMPPTAQPLAYHQFADQHLLFGIPNFMNVVSNLAFLLSGLAGLLFLRRSYEALDCSGKQRTLNTSAEYWSYGVLFTSVVLVAPGSAYYHWEPDNASLLWDRLPIAMGVGALLAAVISERIHPKLGLWALPLLVLMGAGSVIYWYWSEQQGAGNLNFYIVIQFYSLLLVILLSILLPARYTRTGDLYWAVGIYALAKFAETFDQQIFNFGHFISGHTVKHLLAALAIWWIARMLQKRELL